MQGFYDTHFLMEILMRSLCTSKISRNNELRTLPHWYIKRLNGSGKNLLFEGIVPSVSSLPRKCVFSIVVT